MKKYLLNNSGFTLVELMVTVALVAVLMMVAAPSISTFQRNAELTSYVNSMVAAINAARGEAMKRGLYAMVVPTDNSNWNPPSGWIAFVDKDRSRTYNAGDILVLTRDAAPSYLTITANGPAAESPPYIMFDASGYPKTKAAGTGQVTFNIVRNDVGSSEVAAQTRRVIISVTGRVRTCTPSTDSTCTSSATQ